MREFTPLAIILGVVIGMIMGAANAYLGLKYGMTISASIPAAVISMAILRGILRRGTLLENNMVQTVGSAGESLAAGVIFTVPALFILAHDYPDAGLTPEGFLGYLKIVMFGMLGGLLGVFMMIPLRRYLIVKQRDVLPYPEGTACAEVLKSGQVGGTGAALVFGGLAVGALHKFFGGILELWAEKVIIPVKTTWVDLRTTVSMESVASLLGVGFILGLRISAIMVGGGLLAWLGIIPLISYFGQYIDQPLAPATVPIRQLSPHDVWENYIRYIGAGGVVFGGIVSLLKAFPTITASVWNALVQLFKKGGGEERTDRDLPIWMIFGGTVIVIAGVWLMNLGSGTGLAGAIAVAACGFVFVAVASRIVGYVGSTSSPVSGMTIATLLGTGLIFAALGFAGPQAMAALIGVGAVVCIAIAIAGDCSQDLKTGYLVGATPARQQAGEVIGVVTSALTCAVVLLWLNNAFGFVPDDTAVLAQTGEKARETLVAPQANVVALVLKGLLGATGLPWELVLVGMACAFVVECVGVASLPFAVGLYLPLELTTPIFVGGLLHWLVVGRKKRIKGAHAGVLAASGLVAGDALMGLGLAGFRSAKIDAETWLPRLSSRPSFDLLARLMAWRDEAPWHGWIVSLVPFAVLVLFLATVAWYHNRKAGPGAPFATPAPPTPGPLPEMPEARPPKPETPTSKDFAFGEEPRIRVDEISDSSEPENKDQDSA